MLQRTEQARGLPYDNGVAPRHFDLVDLYAFLKSNRRVLAAWVIVALTVALVYAFTATPLYTATVDLTINSKKIQLFKNNEQVVGDNTMDSSQVESEVQVLGSESIAVAVIDDLKLTNDPEFIGTGNGPIVGLLSAIFGMDEDARSLSDFQRKRIAIRVLRGNLSVRRIGLTYVLEISYRSPDPAKAAQIANAFADAYINDQLNTKYQAARRASIWLQERIAELRNQSNVAARSVQDYKEKNNIVDTGNHGLLSDLQVQETNTQMIAAQAATAEAKARLDRIEEVLKSPAPGEALGTVTDTLKNEVITKLRQRYLDDSEHVAKFTAMMGPNHLAVVNLKNEMALLQASMVDELQRIAQTYKSDYEIAKAREEFNSGFARQADPGGGGEWSGASRSQRARIGLADLPHYLREFSPEIHRGCAGAILSDFRCPRDNARFAAEFQELPKDNAHRFAWRSGWHRCGVGARTCAPKFRSCHAPPARCGGALGARVPGHGPAHCDASAEDDKSGAQAVADCRTADGCSRQGESPGSRSRLDAKGVGRSIFAFQRGIAFDKDRA